MEGYEVCGTRIEFPLALRESALDALYDVYEDGVLYDLELSWIDDNDDLYYISNEYIGTDIGREGLHAYADEGLCETCALIGFSDRERTRMVMVMWNPHDDDGVLTLSVYAELPFNDAEKQIIATISEWVPFPDWHE